VELISGIGDLRERLRPERSIAFVPTMGNLHQGHLALVELAQRHGDCVVVSVFVNRLQFGPKEDFDTYPRTLAEDCAALEKLEVDVVFTPDEQELYPEPQQFMVEPPAIARALEGQFRPRFFHGVATVVLKLFNIVAPQVAVFGKKDYQQLHLIREMTRQFNLPIEIISGETVRAPDGLALSSRNNYLGERERAEAPQVYATLMRVRDALKRGNRDFSGLAREAAAYLDSRGWRVDYVALRNSSTLAPAAEDDRHLVVLAAAWLDATRLIDNLEVSLG
jgi:pantoate--beta-alanine ligase